MLLDPGSNSLRKDRLQVLTVFRLVAGNAELSVLSLPLGQEVPAIFQPCQVPPAERLYLQDPQCECDLMEVCSPLRLAFLEHPVGREK